jgi:hypothetical protein
MYLPSSLSDPNYVVYHQQLTYAQKYENQQHITARNHECIVLTDCELLVRANTNFGFAFFLVHLTCVKFIVINLKQNFHLCHPAQPLPATSLPFTAAFKPFHLLPVQITTNTSLDLRMLITGDLHM